MDGGKTLLCEMSSLAATLRKGKKKNKKIKKIGKRRLIRTPIPALHFRQLIHRFSGSQVAAKSAVEPVSIANSYNRLSVHGLCWPRCTIYLAYVNLGQQYVPSLS